MSDDESNVAQFKPRQPAGRPKSLEDQMSEILALNQKLLDEQIRQHESQTKRAEELRQILIQMGEIMVDLDKRLRAIDGKTSIPEKLPEFSGSDGTS